MDTLEQIDRTFKRLTTYISGKMVTLMNEIGDDLIAEVQKVLKEQGKTASNKLIRSIKKEVSVSVGKVALRVFSVSPYMVNVYFGRNVDTKMPPISVIKTWIRTKRRRGMLKFYSLRNQENASYQKRLDAVAFLIARAIQKKGIKALKFFDIALKRAEPRIKERIRAQGFTYVSR